MAREIEVQVEDKKLRLSNLDKVLYPAAGFTKAQVIDYYRRIAPAMLGHLAGRPLTLKRYPDGVDGESFYEKNCPKHRPEWLPTASVWSGHNSRHMNYCVVDTLPGLVWTANLAALELHTSLSRADDLLHPTMVIFDLDPGPPAGLIECAEVALEVRALLEVSSLASCVKTSGKKGMQIYVPLDGADGYDETKTFSLAVAQLLEQRLPGRVTSQMKRELRGGKVFVDWSQNDQHKTTVCVYSLRAEPRPYCSTPVAWSELEAAVKGRDPERLRFAAGQVIARVEKDGDLFARVLAGGQRLPARTDLEKPPRKTPALREYAAKRDFTVTPEPPPPKTAPARSEHPSYMVHKHHARNLHYDLRLEIDGALASWAIPKGPSTDPGVKRLAVQTEDHPLEYGGFEGRIPDGEYGAGDSLIWDRGLFDTLPPGQASAQRDKGHLDLVFVGEKLNGHYHLVRTKDRGGKPQWLFFAAKDGAQPHAVDLVAERPESVVSGKRATRGPVTQAQRAAHAEPTRLLERLFPPMLATLRDALPDGKWTLELKYDGYRAVAALSGGALAMWTRNRLDLCERFPDVARALERLTVGEAVLDGEIVALDARGRPRFERLGEGGEQLYVFDLLWLDGRDLRGEPLETRRDLLESLLAQPPAGIHLSERASGDAAAALKSATRHGYEGLVAKRFASKYESRRSSAWIKLKSNARQELAIVGWTPHLRDAKAVGALLLGVMEKRRLTYAGKVGTGFTMHQRKELGRALAADAIAEPRVAGAPRMRDARWVEPRLVAEVQFTEWTSDGRLRHPAFVELRDDKSPADCVREGA